MKNNFCFLFVFFFSISFFAQNGAPDGQANDSIMVTVFLNHQQDKNLSEIGEILEKNKFWE